MTSVPASWKFTALSEIAEVRLGRQRSPKNHMGETMRRYVRAANVTWDGLSLTDVKSMNFSDAEMDVYRLQPGDLLLSEASGSPGEVGKPALWTGEIDDCAFQNTLIRVRPGEAIEPKFLMHYFRWQVLIGRFVEHSRGVGIYHLGRTRLSSWITPVPPLEEQRRIVNILEGHLSRLHAGTAFVSRAESAASAMVRSVLITGLRGELVDDDLTEGTGADLVGIRPDFIASGDDRVWSLPETWTWARLGDVFEVNVGTTPSRSSLELWAGNLPWVSSGEVSFGRISSTREHITRPAAGSAKTRIHPPGTVMLAMIGEGKTRGQAAILDIEAAHNQNCASIRVSTTKILPEYIFGYLEERYRETRRGGSGGQQPALNKAAIQRFPVPIAPLGTQRRLVEAWASAREVVTRLTYELNLTNTRCGALRRSLLKAAFSGQLSGGDVGVRGGVVA